MQERDKQSNRPAVSEEARDLLRTAMARHAEGDIETAFDAVRRALDLAPGFADARSYLGSTLVTRSRRFAEGLAQLELAREDAPDDPSVYYTLGWCYEFVAHSVSRRPQPGLDATELYAKSESYLRRCLDLNPEGKMRDDAKDLLASIIKEDVE
jgi:tetratricopeptide (TPR) repeat protein